jgi:hypothetical protein
MFLPKYYKHFPKSLFCISCSSLAVLDYSLHMHVYPCYAELLLLLETSEWKHTKLSNRCTVHKYAQDVMKCQVLRRSLTQYFLITLSCLMFHMLAEKCNALTSPFICQVRYEKEKLHSLTFLVTLRRHGKKNIFSKKSTTTCRKKQYFPNIVF